MLSDDFPHERHALSLIYMSPPKSEAADLLLEELTPTNFGDRVARALFRACQDCGSRDMVETLDAAIAAGAVDKKRRTAVAARLAALDFPPIGAMAMSQAEYLVGKIREASKLRVAADLTDSAKLALDHGEVDRAQANLSAARLEIENNGEEESALVGEIDVVEAMTSTEALEIPWVIEGMLAHGDSAIMAGAPKSGKSLLLLELAAAVATGSRFADALEVIEPLPVILIDAENPVRAVRQRLRELGEPRGWDGSGVRYFCRPAWRLDDPKIIRSLEALEPSLIIVDSLSRLLHVEENSNDSVTEAWSESITPLTNAGHTILAIHHRRKQSSEERKEKLEPEAIAELTRGASAFGAVVDQMYSLTRGEGHASVLQHVFARHADPVPANQIEFLRVPLDDGGEGWEIRGQRLSVSIEDAVLKILREDGGEATNQRVLDLMGARKKSGGKAKAIYRVRESLVSRGVIETFKEGRGLVWRIVDKF